MDKIREGVNFEMSLLLSQDPQTHIPDFSRLMADTDADKLASFLIEKT